MQPGPLAGVRVLDLTRVLAAPYATMGLGELGAEVLKVERPGSGDETRQWGPPFVAGEAAYFLAVNRNKESLTADLANPADRALIQRIALTWADVVVENFKPGTLERWGLGLEQLRAQAPRLITASVRGYPPGDDRPGYDFVIQAASGLMSLNGPPDGPGYKVGVAIADITTGLFLLSGILAALYAREKTGRGQHVGVSLWESQLAWFANVAQSYLLTGQEPARWGNAHPQLVPYQLFAAADGHLVVAVGNDVQFAALARVLGNPAWAHEPRFATNPERVAHRDELVALMAAVLVERPCETWIGALTEAGVPAGPVRSVPEALAWAGQAGLSPVVAVDHPLIGELGQIPLPWRFSGTPSGVRRPPPRLGEHNAVVRSRFARDAADAAEPG
ncbi:MAG: CoA transferase [Thermaerobacter sp.]|nr:CoA transferase [Thermaerobacter sp.]